MDRTPCIGVQFKSTTPYTAADNATCPSVVRYNSGVVGWAFVPKNETGLAQVGPPRRPRGPRRRRPPSPRPART